MSKSVGDQPGERPATASPKLALEATLLHHFSTPKEESPAGSLPGSKQDLDVAIAVALMREGRITERQLSQITKNWTAFGTASLAEQAEQQGIITAEQVDEVVSAAQQLLRKSSRQAAASVGGSASRRERSWLSHLDPSGRVSQMLGVADASMLSGDEIEDRSLGARYTLLRKLGQGGLGIVWLARDENLQRYVAVKEIARDVAPNDVALEHFRREAEITGRLEHPGIVPIYQFGRDEKTGRAFYAMRFLGRRTLQDAVAEYHERREAGDEDKMTLHRLLTAFVTVCHAVGHAHEQRIIHRDLKPTNIALDEFDQVTLLDWGLAKINEETGLYDSGGRTEPGDLHSVGSTAMGRVIGTPLYMAPEQASGRLEEVDELTDVYGLGGILYAILTGVGPHQATIDSIETRLATAEVLSRIVATSITPPSELASDVPPELDAICVKALSKKPYRRYSSASELAEDVQRYMAGTPVKAYVAPWKRRVTRWMAKHPTLAQALLLMTSLVLIAGMAILYTARQARQQLRQARYASAVETVRDLEVSLQFEAQSLERDLHFITELPIMRAIVSSQRQSAVSSAETDRIPDASAANTANVGGAPAEVGQDQPAARADAQLDAPSGLSLPPSPQAGTDYSERFTDSLVALQSPAAWLDRQGELFDGFLDANPDYLMMASCLREEDHSFRELVRSERLQSGLRSHRVPKKQLMTSQPDAGDPQLSILSALRPGAVLLTTNDQLHEDIPTNNRSPLVLSGVAAIYDAEGELFGLNVIELDMRERLRNLLTAIAPQYVDVYVTDSAGTIVMEYVGSRFQVVSQAESIDQRFPGALVVLQAEAQASENGDGESFYATLVRLGSSNSKASIGIVAHARDRE